MDIIRTVAYLVTYALNTYAHYLMIEAILRKESRRVNEKLLFLAYFAFYAVRGAIYLFLPVNPYLNVALTLVGLFLLCLLYKSSLIKKLMATAYALVPGLVSDAGTGAVMSIALQMPAAQVYASNSWFLALGMIVQVAITLALTLLCMRLFRDYGEGGVEPSRAYQVASFLIPMLSMALACDLMYGYSLGFELGYRTIFLCTGLLLAINVLAFSLYEKLRNEERTKYEQLLAARQSEVYTHQMALMEKSAQNLKTIRHDIKNHCIAVEHLAKQGRTDEILDYLSQLWDVAIVQEEYVRTGFLPLDGILNYKLAEARDSGAEIHVDVAVSEHIQVEASDLAVILGNLLDNALEGLARSEERWLSVCLRLDQGVLYLEIANSYDGKVLRSESAEQVFKTRKARSEQHGVGIANVKRALKKYDGTLQLKAGERFFTAKSMLYLKREEKSNAGNDDV